MITEKGAKVPKSTAERQAILRAEHKAAGRKEIRGIFETNENELLIKQFAKSLAKGE